METINRQELFIHVPIPTQEINLVVDEKTTSFFRNTFHFFIYYKTLLGSGNIFSTRCDAAENDTTGAGDPLCLVRELPDIVRYLFNRKFRGTVICSDANGDVSVRISICFFKNFQDVTGFCTPSRYNIKSAGVCARDITNSRRAYEEIRHVSTWFCWMFWPITWKWWYLGQQSLVFNSKVLDRIHDLGVTIQCFVHIEQYFQWTAYCFTISPCLKVKTCFVFLISLENSAATNLAAIAIVIIHRNTLNWFPEVLNNLLISQKTVVLTNCIASNQCRHVPSVISVSITVPHWRQSLESFFTF